MLRFIFATACLALCSAALHAQTAMHVWEVREIELRAAHPYANPYTDVDGRLDLQGSGFSQRVYGFWDGGDTFRVRVVATASGDWKWTNGSNQPSDTGLNGKSGAFTARQWTDAVKALNPNRRGFLRSTANGHALQDADGTPFFLTGDTGLAGATWRLPPIGRQAGANYQPGSGGWIPNGAYRFTWYNPRTGEWQASSTLTADARDEFEPPRFPGGQDAAGADWAAKIVLGGRRGN